MLRDRRWLAIFAVGLVALGTWFFALLPRGQTLSLVFLDVGEGMCAVMRTPSGKTVVIDCGTSSWRHPDEVGEKVVVPYLRSLGVGALDLAVLTHPHTDHVSGYPGLLKTVPARLVLDIGATHPSPYYKAFLGAVKETGATYRIARAGQSIDLGDGVVAHILNPDPSRDYSDLNDRSIVLRVSYGWVAFMIAGDAGVEAERSMMSAQSRLRAQILQVGHHGSADATSVEWLAAVRPSLAVICCGRHNEYGHPSEEVTERLRAMGIRAYRTDVDGAVAFTTDGKIIRVRTFSAPR